MIFPAFFICIAISVLFGGCITIPVLGAPCPPRAVASNAFPLAYVNAPISTLPSTHLPSSKSVGVQLALSRLNRRTPVGYKYPTWRAKLKNIFKSAQEKKLAGTKGGQAAAAPKQDRPLTSVTLSDSTRASGALTRSSAGIMSVEDTRSAVEAAVRQLHSSAAWENVQHDPVQLARLISSYLFGEAGAGSLEPVVV